ncbi:MAG: hypothetical protein A2157_00980 [Deltaproteobacteria bacterium RBG_16_47_11]|nr:MAG: hypothetical protein A2157_00980 [Deltaproteobacteria bacterium RBG_16_47_11]
MGYKNFSNFIDLSEGIILATISNPFFHALSLTQGGMECKSILIPQNRGFPASVRHYRKVKIFVDILN